MSNDSENTCTSAAEAATKGPRKAQKTRPAKKTGRAKKAPAEPKADHTNKKAEVIAMMKRAKGATLRNGQFCARKMPARLTFTWRPCVRASV